MATEIERKFLLRDDPAARFADQPGEQLRQGYVAIDGEVEVRVRIGGQGATVTIKGGRGVSRVEVEMPVSADDAEDLWTLAEGRRIHKTRHRVALGTRRGGGAPHVAEIDVYHGALAGLHMVEVEFADDAEAAAFEPPAWFGPELSGDDRWSNARLARDGVPRELVDPTP
jgi:CYTH domain-containing protein